MNNLMDLLFTLTEVADDQVTAKIKFNDRRVYDSTHNKIIIILERSGT